jgi:hypothetical protein
MTPICSRFRSLDDEIAEAASVEWERRCEAYNQHLKEIRDHFSRGARRLLRCYPFHDAQVVALAADESRHFSLFLELDEPAERENKKRLELRYRLVGGTAKAYEIHRHEALSGDGKPFGWWLYDELDVANGEIPAMTHSILFTGGYELRLTFFAVNCRRVDFLSVPGSIRSGSLHSQ